MATISTFEFASLVWDMLSDPAHSSPSLRASISAARDSYYFRNVEGEGASYAMDWARKTVSSLGSTILRSRTRGSEIDSLLASIPEGSECLLKNIAPIKDFFETGGWTETSINTTLLTLWIINFINLRSPADKIEDDQSVCINWVREAAGENGINFKRILSSIELEHEPVARSATAALVDDFDLVEEGDYGAEGGGKPQCSREIVRAEAAREREEEEEEEDKNYGVDDSPEERQSLLSRRLASSGPEVVSASRDDEDEDRLGQASSCAEALCCAPQLFMSRMCRPGEAFSLYGGQTAPDLTGGVGALGFMKDGRKIGGPPMR